MHPILITALAKERRRRRACGAVAQERHGLCRKCQVATVWRPETARTRHRAIPNCTRARAVQIRFFARAASVIRLSSRKAEG